MQDFKNLAVWKKSHSLTVDIYRMTRSLPKDELYGLMNQMKRACVSIEANIAEACGRGSDADFARFVQIAMGSASEVECHLLFTQDLNLLDPAQYQELNVRMVEVKRVLAALLNRLLLYKSMS
jgi:four helix bundle protein